MIGTLKGRVIDETEETVIVDVGGVGYELTCSTNTMGDLLGGVIGRGPNGEIERAEVLIHVYTQLREDALTLFGFSTLTEKKMFLSLLKVNGVGAKMAIKILSGGRLDHLTGMIETGDVKGLSALPKVGKKTAEQLILSLKGKLVLSPESTSRKPGAATPVTPRFTGPRAEILSALVNLGFRLPDVERVVYGMEEEIDLQVGVRRGLQALTGSF